MTMKLFSQCLYNDHGLQSPRKEKLLDDGVWLPRAETVMLSGKVLQHHTTERWILTPISCQTTKWCTWQSS